MTRRNVASAPTGARAHLQALILPGGAYLLGAGYLGPEAALIVAAVVWWLFR